MWISDVFAWRDSEQGQQRPDQMIDGTDARPATIEAKGTARPLRRWDFAIVNWHARHRIGPGVSWHDSNELDLRRLRRAMKTAALEAAATFVVRRSLEFGYRRATGRDLPTARDRRVPFHQVMVWATVTGAALAAATVVVDQAALRLDSPLSR